MTKLSLREITANALTSGDFQKAAGPDAKPYYPELAQNIYDFLKDTLISVWPHDELRAYGLGTTFVDDQKKLQVGIKKTDLREGEGWQFFNVQINDEGHVHVSLHQKMGHYAPPIKQGTISFIGRNAEEIGTNVLGKMVAFSEEEFKPKLQALVLAAS